MAAKLKSINAIPAIKKFEVCPKCQKVLSYETRYLHGSNGTTIEKYCKNCNNFISSEFRQKQTQAQINATTNAAKGYVNLVKRISILLMIMMIKNRTIF